jgi:hypothetical protein
VQVNGTSDGLDALAELSLARLRQALHNNARHDLDILWNCLNAEDVLRRLPHELVLFILICREI